MNGLKRPGRRLETPFVRLKVPNGTSETEKEVLAF